MSSLNSMVQHQIDKERFPKRIVKTLERKELCHNRKIRENICYYFESKVVIKPKRSNKKSNAKGISTIIGNDKKHQKPKNRQDQPADSASVRMATKKGNKPSDNATGNTKQQQHQKSKKFKRIKSTYLTAPYKEFKPQPQRAKVALNVELSDDIEYIEEHADPDNIQGKIEWYQEMKCDSNLQLVPAAQILAPKKCDSESDDSNLSRVSNRTVILADSDSESDDYGHTNRLFDQYFGSLLRFFHTIRSVVLQLLRLRQPNALD